MLVMEKAVMLPHLVVRMATYELPKLPKFDCY